MRIPTDLNTDSPSHQSISFTWLTRACGKIGSRAAVPLCWRIIALQGNSCRPEYSLLADLNHISRMRDSTHPPSAGPCPLRSANLLAIVGLPRVSFLIVTSCALSLARRRFRSVPRRAVPHTRTPSRYDPCRVPSGNPRSWFSSQCDRSRSSSRT